MGKIIWSPTAFKDIDLIAEYISRDSLDIAALFVLEIIRETEILIKFQRSGRKISELNDPSKREIIHGTYRIMYRILKNNDIRITGIVHTARERKL
jgi:toxin ParE1/3/4